MLAGTGDRDPLRDPDYTFAASSQATYLAQRLVFAAVMADAAMVDRLATADLTGEVTAAARRGQHPNTVRTIVDAVPGVHAFCADTAPPPFDDGDAPPPQPHHSPPTQSPPATSPFAHT